MLPATGRPGNPAQIETFRERPLYGWHRRVASAHCENVFTGEGSTAQPNSSESCRRMRRREFIRNAAAATAAVATGSHVNGAWEPRQPSVARFGQRAQPNILVISTDQQCADALSCTGNAQLSTPAIDSLAANGRRYELAYVANPICVPSRTSYMTGKMPHETGVTYNGGDVPFDAGRHPCLAQIFHAAGYDTGHFGKWHIPADIHDAEWSGFNTLDAVRDNEVDFDIVDPCIEFMRRERDQPFLAFASFVNPHDICEYARILSDIPDRLKNGPIGEPPPVAQLPPLPANWDPPPDEPEAIRQQYHHPDTHRVYPSRTWDGPSDPRWRRYLWAYHRMVELVDRRIGRLLDGLRETRAADNTVIVFFSDHGDGTARHQWNQKTLFYDECARVPLIVAQPEPELPVVDRTTLVNIGTDLFPTLFAIAGIRPPAFLKGASALPTADGPPAAAARPFVVAQNNLQTRYGQPSKVEGRMLRSSRYKYVRYNAGANPEQLFDMLRDPLETRSIAMQKDAAAILAEHRGMLADWMRANNDPFAVAL
jgi:arylsulfatase A-like enzyme